VGRETSTGSNVDSIYNVVNGNRLPPTQQSKQGATPQKKKGHAVTQNVGGNSGPLSGTANVATRGRKWRGVKSKSV